MPAKKSSNKKLSYKQAHDRAWWPLIIFFFVLILIVAGVLIYIHWQKQAKYQSISSFVLTSTTGPVAPLFQSTKTITLTAKGCTYSVSNIAETTTTSCNLTNSDFNKLVNAYYSGDIGTKISYNNNSESRLIGGPDKRFTVNFANGSTSSTNITTDFKTNAQNFLDAVSSYVSQYKDLNF